MTALTATRPTSPEPDAAPPPAADERRGMFRWLLAGAVVVVWWVLGRMWQGEDTLDVGGQDTTPLHDRLSEWGGTLGDNAWALAVGDAITWVVEQVQHVIVAPVPPSPIPYLGWLGVVAVATWIGYAVANWRIAVLVALSFLSFGAFGYWEDSMDLLAVTLVAVAFTVAVGFPLAIWIGLSKRAERGVTLVLDVLQTMPTFVYLVPALIFFGIGTPTAVVCTMLYALPPIVRIAGHGIRDVSPTTIEATESLGQSVWQRLWKVQVPMARSTIILGLNQTILAALSMAIIASYVAGPGLGKPVLSALTQNNFGQGLVPGALIVVMGIMLDRLTTAASRRSEAAARGGEQDPRRRRFVLVALLVPVAVAVWYSRYAIDAALFPETTWAATVEDYANRWMDAFIDATQGIAGGFRDLISYGLLNPMEDLLANTPWWLAFTSLLILSVVIGGLRALLPALVCLTGIRLLDLWNDSMIVLNMTLVATLLVMVLAVVLGVWTGRSRRADLVLRPLLDAGQTIPAFVYLLPVLALFGSTRFTAIVAGVIYAAPAAIKLVADGISGIPEGPVEAGRSTGSTRFQEITKVQLPMARSSLVLAANQGLLFVLAMVVIGGLVGAGALGYDVVLGLAHEDKWGKGLAAGVSIVLLGVWLDRVTKAAAARTGAHT